MFIEENDWKKSTDENYSEEKINYFEEKLQRIFIKIIFFSDKGKILLRIFLKKFI